MVLVDFDTADASLGTLEGRVTKSPRQAAMRHWASVALVAGWIGLAMGVPSPQNANALPDAFTSARAGSPGGTIVYTVAHDSGTESSWLEASGLDGSDRHLLTSLPTSKTRRLDTKAALSPDGSKVAFVRQKATGNALYIVNTDGSGLTRLVGPDQAGRGIGGRRGFGLRWSPDGTKIAFVRETRTNLPNGRWGCNTLAAEVGLYVVGIDGSSLRRLSAALPASSAPSTEYPVNILLDGWTPDGRRIDYGILRWGGGECIPAGGGYVDSVSHFEIDSDGSGRSTLPVPRGVGLGALAWSPDGSKLAYSLSGAVGCDIFLRSASGGPARRLVTHSIYGCQDGGGLEVAWLPSGEGLVFADGQHVGLADPTKGHVRTLLKRNPLPADCHAGNPVCEDSIAAISADGSDVCVIDYESLGFPETVSIIHLSDNSFESLKPRAGHTGAVVTNLDIRFD